MYNYMVVTDLEYNFTITANDMWSAVVQAENRISDRLSTATSTSDKSSSQHIVAVFRTEEVI